MADVLDQAVEDEERRAAKENEKAQEPRQRHVQLRQALDAGAEPKRNRHQRDGGDDCDQHKLHAKGVVEAKESRQARVHLGGAEAERGGDAEHRGDDCQHVGGMTHRAAALRQDRRQHGTHRERQSAVEGNEREAQADDAVDGPRVQTPVQKGEAHRIPCRGGGVHRLAPRRGLVVQERLGHRVEQQANAHAGAEQHGEPLPTRELRPRIRATEPHRTAAPERRRQREHEQRIGREHIEPAEGRGDGHLQRPEHRIGAVEIGKGGNGEDEDDQHGRHEHRCVHAIFAGFEHAPLPHQAVAIVTARGSEATASFAGVVFADRGGGFEQGYRRDRPTHTGPGAPPTHPGRERRRASGPPHSCGARRLLRLPGGE